MGYSSSQRAQRLDLLRLDELIFRFQTLSDFTLQVDATLPQSRRCFE